MQWHAQAGNITTNIQVKLDFTLPPLSATNVVMWNCHVDVYVKDRYDMILGRYISIESVFNLKLSDHFIEADDGPFKGYTTHMVGLGMFEFKDLNTGKLHLRIFTNAYLEEVYD